MTCPRWNLDFHFPHSDFFFVFVFFNIPFELPLSPLYTTYFDRIGLFLILLAWKFFYHTKSKVTWENFQISFYLTLQFITSKKQVTRFPRLISNISFIPVQWTRRDVGNSLREFSDLFFFVRYFSRYVTAWRNATFTYVLLNFSLLYQFSYSFLIFEDFINHGCALLSFFVDWCKCFNMSFDLQWVISQP